LRARLLLLRLLLLRLLLALLLVLLLWRRQRPRLSSNAHVHPVIV
jgi:hypothetical protein